MKPSGRARLAPSSTISSSAFFCFFGGKSKDLQKRSPEVLFIYFQLKAECWRIYAFELWCWRSLLRFPWTAGRFTQSILKQISPEYSLEGWMLKLKLQFFGQQMQELTHLKRPWCWERLKAAEGDNRGWDGWMVSPTQWTWVWVSSGSWWCIGRPGVLQSMGLQRVRHDWVIELNWRKTNIT